MKKLILILMYFGLTSCTNIDPHVVKAIYQNQLEGKWGVAIVAKEGEETPLESPFGKLRIILKGGEIFFKDSPEELYGLDIERFKGSTVKYSVETSVLRKKLVITTTTLRSEQIGVKFDMKFLNENMVALSKMSMHAPQHNNANMNALLPIEARQLRLYLKKVSSISDVITQGETL